MTILRLISFRLVRRVASLSVNDLQGLKVDKKGLILAFKAYSQLVRQRQELFHVRKKDYVGTNIEMKDDVAVNSFKKDGDESIQNYMRGCRERPYSAFPAMKIHLQFMQQIATQFRFNIEKTIGT